MFTYKKTILLSLLYLTTALQAATTAIVPTNVYHQILPLITKKIDTTHPTDAQRDLLNGSTMFLEHGSNYSTVQSEIIQAIASVDYFTDILPQYFKTHTVSGFIQAALITAKMTDQLNILKYRQSIIAHLIENPTLLEKLHNAFAKSQPGEHALLTSLSFNKKQLELINGMKISAKEKLYFTSDIFKSCNNKYILGTLKRIKTSNFIMLPSIIFDTLLLKYFCNISFSTMKTAFNEKNVEILSKIIKENPGKSSVAIGTICGLFAINYMITKPDVTQDFDIIHDQQKHLIDIAKLINQIKSITTIITKDAVLNKLFCTEVTKLHELFNPTSENVSDNLKYVISELQSSSFKGEPSYFFSKQGKILATHYYLEECKAELVSYLEAFGRIDAYVSAAKLYQKFQNNPRVKFCLPEFITSETPVIDITDYWHPLIDPSIVVTNSLNIGNGSNKNLMITGPNAGGKTTSLMSLIINIIFAQSFGIAPSAKLVMTPFSKIHSYLDITTNLQEGLSLFAAEVDRAKKLKNSITSCTPGQKTFTIIDEIFSGTAPDVASDIGFKFATQLGDMTHSMTIITTHFPALTKVGQDSGTFTNYKVADATIMPNGKIVYPFKLVPGISTQNIAQHMLEQQNLL